MELSSYMDLLNNSSLFNIFDKLSYSDRIKFNSVFKKYDDKIRKYNESLIGSVYCSLYCLAYHNDSCYRYNLKMCVLCNTIVCKRNLGSCDNCNCTCCAGCNQPGTPFCIYCYE